MSVHTPLFMQSFSKYQDVQRDCKILINDTQILQGNSAAVDLDRVLHLCRECCDGGKLHTTVSYHRLRLELIKGTVCDPQRAFLGDNLLLICTPAKVEPRTSPVGMKIYRLFPSCSTMKRKSEQKE
jgi:hypothetical protein